MDVVTLDHIAAKSTGILNRACITCRAGSTKRTVYKRYTQKSPGELEKKQVLDRRYSLDDKHLSENMGCNDEKCF
jgi:hypothetical protein